MLVVVVFVYHGLNEIIQNAHDHNLDTYIIEFHGTGRVKQALTHICTNTKCFNLTQIIKAMDRQKQYQDKLIQSWTIIHYTWTTC